MRLRLPLIRFQFLLLLEDLRTNFEALLCKLSQIIFSYFQWPSVREYGSSNVKHKNKVDIGKFEAKFELIHQHGARLNPNKRITSTSLPTNATGSQRGLSMQPCFIEVANPHEQPYSGIKRPEAHECQVFWILGYMDI